jgi:hypothetical protein
LNNLISLSDLTEDELLWIIETIYPNKNKKKSLKCIWWCWIQFKWNMIMCDQGCLNSKNYLKNDLCKIKKWMNFILNSNFKIEKELLKKYMVEKINTILTKKNRKN